MIAEFMKEVHVKNIKVVSFDVFDTLLLRTCTVPQEIYSRMFEKESKLFPSHITSEDWKKIRQTAERKARKQAYISYENYEVTLDDIYCNLPKKLFNITELKKLELQCEKEYCFVNNEINNLLHYVKENTNCRVILCSDMYLSSSELSDILVYNGFDLSLIDRIYISSEYKQSKRYVSLFRTVLSDYGIAPYELYHIGDNQYSDVGVPQYLGINVCQYNVISEAAYKYPFLSMERQVYVSLCDELRPLRLMASTEYCDKSTISEDNQFWFDQGAMIYGPFLTFAAEWILDEADKKDIQVIRPLMREGEFLTTLLDKAAAFRTKKYNIEPLYISRFSIFTALFEKITTKEIEYLSGTYNISLSDMFRILKIEDRLDRYQQYAGYAMNDLIGISGDGISMHREIVNYLETPEMINLIRERNKGSSQLLVDYLKEMGMTVKSVTVDVGWRGSIQNAIHKVLGEKGFQSEILHLLLICNPSASENVIEGCDIRGFMGNYGSCEHTFRELSVRVMELMLLSEKGTTIGYERKGGKISPVTRAIAYPEWQVHAMKCLQKGIKSFQNVYYSMVEKKPYLRRWVSKSEELCKIIGRLHSYPITTEAKWIGQLEYDQNFGANTLNKIIDDSMLKHCRMTKVTDFYGADRGNSINWYSGLNVLAVDRFFYCKNMAFADRRYVYLSMIYLTERILNETSDRVVLVTAGEMTKIVLQLLSIVGELRRVVGIVDNDVMVHKSKIGGIEIYPVDYEFDNPLYVFTTRRKEFYEALHTQLMDLKEGQLNAIGFFDTY